MNWELPNIEILLNMFSILLQTSSASRGDAPGSRVRCTQYSAWRAPASAWQLVAHVLLACVVFLTADEPVPVRALAGVQHRPASTPRAPMRALLGELLLLI